jgi:uncharacterized protein YceK
MANVAWFYPEEGGMRVYGGVRGNCEALQSVTTDTSEDAPKGGDRAFAILKHSLDLPLSAVADTVTLPITIPCSLWYQTHNPGPLRDGPETLPSQEQTDPQEGKADPTPERVHGGIQ